MFFFGGERDFDGEIPKERTNSLKKKKRFFKYFRKLFPRLNRKPLLKEGFFFLMKTSPWFYIYKKGSF